MQLTGLSPARNRRSFRCWWLFFIERHAISRPATDASVSGNNIWMTIMRKLIALFPLTLLLISCRIGTQPANEQTYTYNIVDTNVEDCFSNNSVISCPSQGESFYGQDAHYQGNVPSYIDNGDGTITDNVTGLMWQSDMGEKITFSEAITIAETLILGGYDDWRVPTIKELYSLILFTGSS